MALLIVLKVVEGFLGVVATDHVALVSELRSIRIVANSVEQFLSVAPRVISFEYRYCVFDLWINGCPTGFEMGHLDQSAPGVHFRLLGACGELERERIFELLRTSFLEVARNYADVEVELGQCFDELA